MTLKTTASSEALTGTSGPNHLDSTNGSHPSFSRGHAAELEALARAGERLRNLSQIERASVEPLRVHTQLLRARSRRIAEQSDNLRSSIRGFGNLSGQV